MRKTTNRKQGGFTLIELAVVIAIIVVAIAAIISRRGATDQTAKIQTEAGNLQAILGKVNSTFAGRINYSGASTSLLLAQGAFPTSMVNGTSVVNAWQGAVTVDPAPGLTTVDITYAGVPTSACIELVANTSRSYNEVTVNSTKTKNGAALSDLAATQTACSASATNTIVFNAS
ncbi:prepilin-type N-terminal cleavage/methylation domain-containing protein [Roseateles asaccharophilus]|uniref:type 4 pilus major pilin n=1 Tax=Roseateles asaccharophilus TaxID=582607 RepID=UPI0038361EBC